MPCDHQCRGVFGLNTPQGSIPSPAGPFVSWPVAVPAVVKGAGESKVLSVARPDSRLAVSSGCEPETGCRCPVNYSQASSRDSSSYGCGFSFRFAGLAFGITSGHVSQVDGQPLVGGCQQARFRVADHCAIVPGSMSSPSEVADHHGLWRVKCNHPPSAIETAPPASLLAGCPTSPRPSGGGSVLPTASSRSTSTRLP